MFRTGGTGGHMARGDISQGQRNKTKTKFKNTVNSINKLIILNT